MCNRLSDLGLKSLEINKEEKAVIVTALKLLDCKAKAMQADTASMLNEERELNCVVLSHVCDQLTDKIETLFAPPAPSDLPPLHRAERGPSPELRARWREGSW